MIFVDQARNPREDGNGLPLLRFAKADLACERPAGADEDVHFLEELVALVLEELRLSVMR
ncbi:MAG: hypothetical protein M3R66_15955 [Actinomycetota bacterium]|nr:hypothetical protein [Actinomycetota bacterium]